jgi:uncharacterized protein
MKLVLDSSAFAKRYMIEDGTEIVAQLLQDASQLALCVILVPEIISGLNRRLRERVLSQDDYRHTKNQLLSDVHDAVLLQVTPAVISRTLKLLENNILRAMDALHVACALEWQADLFVSADKRQVEAASNAGLYSKYIGK